MSRSLPPLTWFLAFEAAARHLSFTAAAEELGLTQSAISQHVRSLEVRFGTQLFLRMPRGLALTDDGRKLLPQAGAALETLAAAASTFDTGSTSNLLTIATSVSVAQWTLAPHLQSFLKQRPNLRIRMLSTIWPDDFKSSIADVEIRFGSKKQVGAGAVRLQPDDLVAVASPALTGPLDDQALIEVVGMSVGWQSWSKHAKIEHTLSPSIHVDSHGLALEFAAHGNGVALTSSMLAQAAIASGQLVEMHPLRLKSPEGFFMAINATSADAQDFGVWLTEILKQQS